MIGWLALPKGSTQPEVSEMKPSSAHNGVGEDCCAAAEHEKKRLENLRLQQQSENGPPLVSENPQRFGERTIGQKNLPACLPACLLFHSRVAC